jgi:tetratricopeptide (TPR) repeat protein
VKRFLATIFILNLLKAPAQEIDSIIDVAGKIHADTEKVNLFYKNGFAARNKDPQFAFNCAMAGNEAAQRSESKKHTAKIYNLLGVLYYKKGDFKTATKYHQQALELRLACNDVLGVAFSQTNLGNIYTDLKLFARAENAYSEALKIYNRLNNAPRSIDCLNNLGVLKQGQKEYGEACRIFKMGFDLAHKINDYESKVICLNNLAVIYGLQGENEKALAMNEDALKLRLMMENELDVSDSYLNLVPYYIYMKEIKKAKEYLDTAYAIANRYNYFETKYKAFRNFATYYQETKDFEKAYYWMKRYDDTKDSILAMQSAVREIYDFNDKDLFIKKGESFRFPYLYLNVLLIICILAIGFIMTNKR